MTKRNGLCCAAVLLLLLALLSVAVCGDAREQEALNGVTEMGIQRTPCYGSCPVYSATIAADGTIHYTGIRNVRRTGDHTAKVSAEKFRGLARFLLEKGFPGLKDDYSERATDMPSVITTAKINGRTKTVRRYGRAGPKELSEMEHRVDALLAEAQWDDQKPSSAPCGRVPAARESQLASNAVSRSRGQLTP